MAECSTLRVIVGVSGLGLIKGAEERKERTLGVKATPPAFVSVAPFTYSLTTSGASQVAQW